MALPIWFVPGKSQYFGITSVDNVIQWRVLLTLWPFKNVTIRVASQKISIV